METINSSIARLRASYTVLRTNKVLIWYLVAIFLFELCVVGVGVAGYIGSLSLATASAQRIVGIASIAITLFLLNLFGIFASAVIFISASSALEGERVSFRNSWTKVWKNKKYLVQWWLFTSAVALLSFVINLGLEKIFSIFGKGVDQIISGIVGNFLSIGWSFATYFAVPVIMTHPDKPVATLKRSASLIKRSWGENLAAGGSIILMIFVILALSGFVIGGINYAIMLAFPAVPSIVFGIVFFAIDGPLFAALLLLSSATQAIFSASLYRYAETGDYVGPFTPEMIQGAFPKKKKFLGRK